MTGINDPNNLNGKLFGYKIKYTDPVNTSVSSPRFNGNIAEVDWKTATNVNDNKRRYSYQYDRLNRLLQGAYSEEGLYVVNNDFYNEVLTYDLNGNIKTLKRFSNPYSGNIAEKIDDLIYNYTGNRLDLITLPPGVLNNSSGYNALENTITYDPNGNMKTHLDKGIGSISYNHLNLPSSITMGANKMKTQINYLYRADGLKLRKNIGGSARVSSVETDYIDGFQYQFINDFSICIGCPMPSPELQFIPTSEGYFDFVKNKYIYHYNDHLGNVRLSYFKNDNNSVEVLEENNYYPFGLKHTGYNALLGNQAYQYKYNGKELQETGMYDYGARFYMPDIGRWGMQDDLSELQLHYSPYSYVYNNPIFFNDPTGMIGEACEGCPKPDPKKIYEGGKIEDVVITAYRSIKTKTADFDFSKVASMLAPIRPLSTEEQNVMNARYGEAHDLSSSLNIMWRQIKDVPDNLADTWENIKNIGDSEDKEEAIVSMAILMVNLKKGKIGNVAKMGVGKSTSGWVISKVFNSLDTAIQAKIKNAISKGIVAPTGQQGIIKLTATEAAQTGYQYKIKILGKGGDIRVYGNPNVNGHIVFEKVMGH